MDDGYLPRLADRRLEALLAELPAVMVVGPRAAGKTTTARRHAATTIRLDSETQSRAMRADPDVALAAAVEPVLLDEWQEVPGVLSAVKRAVDGGFRPNRFILTGSARADIDAAVWPGTGRVVRVTMSGLVMRELTRGNFDQGFLETIRLGGLQALQRPAETPDLAGYLDYAVRGGFPEAALAGSLTAREAILGGYVDQLVTRDLSKIGERRDPGRVRTFLTALALNTAGVVAAETLNEAASVNYRTGAAYTSLLQDLCIYDELPAWSSNLLKRLTRAPKRYLTDSGLVAAIAEVGVEDVLLEGSMLGRLLDTFVVAQLRAEVASISHRARLFHLRQEKGAHEVDVLVEFPMRRVLGIEIKASSGPRPESARHLAWLRDELGDKFIGGVVLHTGPHVYPLGERIIAAPISSLWA